jgi:hypothetical protein
MATQKINKHRSTYIGQRIGFSTQNNTILCNQVRTKILSALHKMGDIEVKV